MPSANRIPTSHTGGLFRPANLPASGLSRLLGREEQGASSDPRVTAMRLREAVSQVVRQQLESGLDIIGDGELGKGDHLTYVTHRLSGLGLVERRHEWKRFLDWERFPDYYDKHPLFAQSPLNIGNRSLAFVDVVRYSGQDELRQDLANLRSAMDGLGAVDGFYPCTAPGIVLDYYPNNYYPSDRDCLFAIAEALSVEYRAVVDAGFLLQIDAPDLAQNYCLQSFCDLKSYRLATELRIEALNHALKDIPRDRIRVHVCWGSWWGPHQTDVPLAEIINLLLKLRMSCLSIEAATVNHAADWHVWEQVRVPDDLVIMPGMITHKTDTVEDAQLVADHLGRYTRIFGNDRVIAGTDCGMVRCATPSLAWAKFAALVAGAALASRAR